MNTLIRKLKPLALLLSFALVGTASANDWPAAGRPIQLTVPSPGGGGTGDTIARLLAEQLAVNLKTSFVIDNRPGANGNIGAAAAAKFQPDGYRFLFSWAGTLAVNINLYEKIAYDPQKDFDPIALICDVPNILVLNSTLPPKTVKEFVAYTQANPGKLNFGSTGIGSSMHLAGELFMRETGTKMVHVPFNAPGTATTNLLSNEIQLMFQLIPGIATQVKAGKVNALAVMAPTRSPALPDVPTTLELGFPKLQSTTWFALLAPRGTPPEIISKMNLEVNKILKDPAFTKRLADIGATPLGGSPKDLSDHLGSEITKWGSLIKANGIKAQ
jgi:tripartite-type tricarboxylate transporter receptor subunit TctC